MKSKFNLIIADPPYNLNKDFKKKKKKTWLDETKNWLSICYDLLSDEGNIFVYGIHYNIGCSKYDVQIGYKYRRQIIWHYENGFAGYGKYNQC